MKHILWALLFVGTSLFSSSFPEKEDLSSIPLKAEALLKSRVNLTPKIEFTEYIASSYDSDSDEISSLDFKSEELLHSWGQWYEIRKANGDIQKILCNDEGEKGIAEEDVRCIDTDIYFFKKIPSLNLKNIFFHDNRNVKEQNQSGFIKKVYKLGVPWDYLRRLFDKIDEEREKLFNIKNLEGEENKEIFWALISFKVLPENIELIAKSFDPHAQSFCDLERDEKFKLIRMYQEEFYSDLKGFVADSSDDEGFNVSSVGSFVGINLSRENISPTLFLRTASSGTFSSDFDSDSDFDFDFGLDPEELSRDEKYIAENASENE